MAEMPFMTPTEFAGGVRPPEAGAAQAALWFVFRGDQLLVELGRPDPRPRDDPPMPARPAFARLSLLKNNNPLWSEPLRTLYLGGLGDTGCWAAEVKEFCLINRMTQKKAADLEKKADELFF